MCRVELHLQTHRHAHRTDWSTRTTKVVGNIMRFNAFQDGCPTTNSAIYMCPFMSMGRKLVRLGLKVFYLFIIKYKESKVTNMSHSNESVLNTKVQVRYTNKQIKKTTDTNLCSVSSLGSYMTLPAFAAERGHCRRYRSIAGVQRRRPQLSIDSFYPQGAQQQTSRTPLLLSMVQSINQSLILEWSK